MITQARMINDVSAAFLGEDHRTEKQILAQHVLELGKNWCDNNPEALNYKGLTRPEIRRKKRANKIALNYYIEQQLENEKKAAEENHATQFLGIMGVILLAILSAVISWVVQKLLDEYFEQ